MSRLLGPTRTERYQQLGKKKGISKRNADGKRCKRSNVKGVGMGMSIATAVRCVFWVNKSKRERGLMHGGQHWHLSRQTCTLSAYQYFYRSPWWKNACNQHQPVGLRMFINTWKMARLEESHNKHDMTVSEQPVCKQASIDSLADIPFLCFLASFDSSLFGLAYQVIQPFQKIHWSKVRRRFFAIVLLLLRGAPRVPILSRSNASIVSFTVL